MSGPERDIAMALARAGVWGASHLHRLMGRNGRWTRVTVQRYLTDPPAKRDVDLVSAMAEPLKIDPPKLAEMLRRLWEDRHPEGDSATRAYLNGSVVVDLRPEAIAHPFAPDLALAA